MMTTAQKKELQKQAYGLKQWGDLPTLNSASVQKQMQRDNRRRII